MDTPTEEKKRSRCARPRKIKTPDDKKAKKLKKQKEKKDKKNKKNKKGGAGESDGSESLTTTDGDTSSIGGKSVSRASSRQRGDTTTTNLQKKQSKSVIFPPEGGAEQQRKKPALSVTGPSRSASRTDMSEAGGSSSVQTARKQSRASIAPPDSAAAAAARKRSQSVLNPNTSRTSMARKPSAVGGAVNDDNLKVNTTTTDDEGEATGSETAGGTKKGFFSLRKKSSKASKAGSIKQSQSTDAGTPPTKKNNKPQKKRSMLGKLWGGDSAPAGVPTDVTTEDENAAGDDETNVNTEDIATNFHPDAEDLSQEQMRQQCLRLLSELENLYNSSTIESQVDHYKRLNEFLDGEIKNAVKTAEQIQVAVEKYEDEKLSMADRLGELYKEAIKQRRLAKAIDIKERYAKLMEDSEEGKRVSAMQLDQVDWNEELRNDYKFWVKQWERDEIRFAKEEELLAEDYKHQSAEYYEMKAVTDKATRQMREVQEEFRTVVDGYRGQLSELKEKMLEVIKRERARHHFLQERLERRESERATRYEVLQEIRDKAVKATYNVHTRFANYIMQVKNRWKIAEADLEKLATSKKGKITLSPEAQELIAELKIFNPRRLERIKNDLNAQVEQLRSRLRETLKQKRPLVAKRAEMLRRMREEKESKGGSDVRSDDSGFAVHPMKLSVSGTSNYEKQFEREQFYLDTEEDRKLFEKEEEQSTEKEDFYTERRKKTEEARRDSQTELEQLMTGASITNDK